MLNHHNAKHASDQKAAKHAFPDREIDEVIVETAEDGGTEDANKKSDFLDMSVLPHHQFFFAKITNVGGGMLGSQFEHEPADVRPHEAFGNIIRIFIVVNVLMVGAVVGTPIEARVFEGAGTENECEQLHGPFSLERQVRKQTMIAKRDAHRGGRHHESKHGPLKPSLFECYDIPGNYGNREKECSNQEYASDPIDPLEGNAEC